MHKYFLRIHLACLAFMGFWLGAFLPVDEGLSNSLFIAVPVLVSAAVGMCFGGPRE